MSSIVTNGNRIARYTSSEIVALTKEGKVKGTWGAPALTYIEEKKMEMRLERSIDSDTDSRPTNWGSLVELVVASSLKDEYDFVGKETIPHPTLAHWAGSPDGFKKNTEQKTVIDFKCPFTMKSFCQLVDGLYEGKSGMDAMNHLRDTHKDGEKFYWQLVSNACLSGATHAELIVYCPYKSDLDAIRQAAQMLSEDSRYYFIAFAKDDELPYIKDGGYYKSLNTISFEVPQEDKDRLTQLVIKATQALLQKNQSLNNNV
jgi:hypothetical protein